MLTIGRVGLDIEWRHLRTAAETSAGQVTLSGIIRCSSLEQSRAVRSELEELRGRTVPVTSTADPMLDGFYVVGDATVNIDRSEAGFLAPGHFNFSVTLQRIGNTAGVEFETRLTGATLNNDHAATPSPFLAPPRGHTAFDVRGEPPDSILRAGADGDITVYRDVDRAKYPRWGITPAAFYAGASVFKSGTPQHVRAGRHTPATPVEWTLENELVQVTPVAGASAIDVRHHDGAQWAAAKRWAVQSGGVNVPAWSDVAILDNTAEEVIIRLISPVAGGGRHTLNLALRRGSRFVRGHMTTNVARALKICRTVAEAGVAGTGYVRAAVNDADGNRYVIGSAHLFAADVVTGGIEKVDATSLDFFLGAEVGGGAAQAGDQADDLMAQYVGYVAEESKAVLR